MLARVAPWDHRANAIEPASRIFDAPDEEEEKVTDNGPGELSAESVGEKTIARSFELTARRIMAYAASIKDPNPLFFDDLRPGGLVGHPFMGFSFQWACRFTPQLPPNPRAAPYGVHALTDLRLDKPFRQGELITCQGQAVSALQIRPGVFQNTRFTLTDSHGDRVAEMDYAGITRGATLAGGPRIIEEIPAVPDVAAAPSPLFAQSIPITVDAAQIYTECADIYNPIHTERSVATAAGLPDVILHGTATQAIACTTVVDQLFGGDHSCVRRFHASLRAMVLLGTSITVRCLGREELANGNVGVAFDVLNEAGQQALAEGFLEVTA
jgi:acyl dehydratase